MHHVRFILQRMTGESSWLDDMPQIYDRCLGPALFEPYARHLAGIAAELAPASVLELAAGTGIVTAQLVRALPAAAITATDLNPAMVAWASQQVDGPTWLRADAQSLDFDDASFDLVLCQFGVMFFPDKPTAFAQSARVLRAGGRFVFAVWDAAEASDFPAALMAGLAEMFPVAPPDFIARIPHGYHDAERITQDVTAGGLAVESIERVVLRGSAPSAAVLAEGFCYGTPLRFALAERGDLTELYERVVEQLTTRLGAGPLEGDNAAYVVTAVRS